MEDLVAPQLSLFAPTDSAAPTSPVEVKSEDLPDDIDYQKSIANNLVMANIVVSRPTARVQMAKVDVQVGDDQNVKIIVSEGDSTTPQWKLDIPACDPLKIWQRMDTNRQKIYAVRDFFAVGDSLRGEYLVNFYKVPKLLQQLRVLEKERMDLADELFANRELYKQAIQTHYASVWETQLKDALAFLVNPRDRFGVTWVFRPLTVKGAEEFDWTGMDPEEAKAAIEATKAKMQEMAKERFACLLETIFGEIVNVCDEITGTGDVLKRKRTEGILKIVTILDKLNNFDNLASPKVLAAVASAKAQLETNDADAIRQNDNIRQTVKAAFGELKAVISEHVASFSKRADRDLD